MHIVKDCMVGIVAIFVVLLSTTVVSANDNGAPVYLVVIDNSQERYGDQLSKEVYSHINTVMPARNIDIGELFRRHGYG
jgi:hypothetical protein